MFVGVPDWQPACGSCKRGMCVVFGVPDWRPAFGSCKQETFVYVMCIVGVLS